MAYLSTAHATAPSFLGRVSEIKKGLAQGFQNWRAYRRTLNELAALSTNELQDLGLDAQDLKTIAMNATYGAAK